MPQTTPLVRDAGVPFAWVLADALYGSDSRLRHMLEARGQAYVLAVRSNQMLRMLSPDGFLQTNPAEMANELPSKCPSGIIASLLNRL